MFQIERDAIFAAQPVQRRYRDVVVALRGQRYTVRAEIWRVLSTRIWRVRIFDLDDTSAQSRQQERGERPRQSVREIENREATQRARLCRGLRVVEHHSVGRSLTTVNRRG